MKRPKRLTWEQKIAVSAYHLNPKDWALLKNGDVYMTIVNKHDKKKTMRIDKFARARGWKK